MNPRTIRVDVTNGVATLTLHRPDRRNALSIDMRREISAALGSWRDDPQVGAVILTGVGPAAVARSILEAPAHALRFTKAFCVTPGATFEESFRVEHDRAFEEIILHDRRG